MKRLLGVDFGEKNVGLAVTDLSQQIVYPYKTIKGFNSLTGLFLMLKDICNEQQVEAVVWGIPLGVSGLNTPQSERLRSLAKRLGDYLISIPVFTFDESFSSFEADEILKTLPQKGHYTQHELAATIVLKKWLESMNR